MSVRSLASRFSGTEVDSKMTDAGGITQLAYFKGALVAVRMVNKQSINLTRNDLIEMKQVNW